MSIGAPTSFSMNMMVYLLLAGMILPVPGMAQGPFLRAFARHLDTTEQTAPEYWQAEASAIRIRVADAGWKPALLFNASLPGLTRQIEAILQDDGSQVFVPRSQAYGNASLNLSQAIPWTGGRLDIRSGLFHVQNFAPWANVSWQSLPVMVSLYQPVFGGKPLIRERENLLTRHHIAIRKLDQASRTRLQEMTGDWLAWIRARNTYEVALANLSRSDSLISFIDIRRRAGGISVGEWEQASLLHQQNRNRADLAFAAFQAAESAFIIRWECPACLLEEFPDKMPPPLSFTEEDIPQLLEAQPTWLDFDLSRRLLDQEYQDLRLNGKPQMAIQAGIGLNQTGSTLAESYRQPVASQYATMTLSYQLLDWQKRRQQMAVVSAELRAVDAEQQQFRRDQLAVVIGGMQHLAMIREVWPRQQAMGSQSRKSLAWHSDMLRAGQIPVENWFRAEEAHLANQLDYLNQQITMWELWLQLQLLDPNWLPQ